MIFHNSTRKITYQKIKIKLNSRTWMTLKSSVVIFQALNFGSLNGLYSLNNLHGLKVLYNLISWKNNARDGWILPGNQITNIGFFFCGMDYQKSKFSLKFAPFLLVSRYYFFKNWSLKLKCSCLRISEPPSKELWLAYFYLSNSKHLS